jgi:hypothetical protein
LGLHIVRGVPPLSQAHLGFGFLRRKPTKFSFDAILGDKSKKVTIMKNKMEDLANLAYERELDRELAKLQQYLELYRHRQNKFFQMSEMKLKFMQETSDEILRLYDHLEADQAVSRAVALGLLSKEELPQDMRESNP